MLGIELNLGFPAFTKYFTTELILSLNVYTNCDSTVPLFKKDFTLSFILHVCQDPWKCECESGVQAINEPWNTECCPEYAHWFSFMCLCLSLCIVFCIFFCVSSEHHWGGSSWYLKSKCRIVPRMCIWSCHHIASKLERQTNLHPECQIG